ncbi:MAG: T9SS type A sorting domain-containing protein [Flavobacteriaceae bacterium]|jgi:hypothetical protein|nr:T9SS type A sorting domain-containing protein [Flavobacteriaceae bacterium]
MRKILFSIVAVGFATSAFSQSIMTDDFESYTVGNLNSQGGWAVDATPGANANMAKIANIDATHGKSLQMASTAANTQGLWVYKEFNYGNADPDNMVAVAELDMYTGNNGAEVQFYEVVGDNYYVIWDIYLDSVNGAILFDQADFDTSGSGEFLTGSIANNTWYKVKVTYNIEEGTISVDIDGTTYGPFQKELGHYPTEIDVVTAGVNNSGYDNIVISATSVLAVSDVTKSSVNVYPNPTKDIINITSDKKVSDVVVYDLSGKSVKIVKATTSVDIQSLEKGIYIVKINFADGTSESKKIIKE